MNWGKGIIVTFILFAALVITMAVISMKQEVGLVAPDYYKQEIAYQDQIDRINNYNALKEKPVVKIDRSRREVVLKFPESSAALIQSGELQLFRPSKTGIDQTHRIRLNEKGEQRINVSQYLKGRWKVKLSWEMNAIGYYNEIAINI